MNRDKTLREQFEEANKNFARAKEIETLTLAHSDICKQVRDKSMVAIGKIEKGQLITEAEQLEISELGEQQADAYRKLADKILNTN